MPRVPAQPEPGPRAAPRTAGTKVKLALAVSLSDSLSQGDSQSGLEACHSWQYDTRDFQNTIQQSWDLVCEDKIMTKVGSFVFFAGTGVGVLIAGS